MFAPCVPSVNPRFTLSVAPLSVFIRFYCHLLRCVAIVSLIIPLCCHQLSSSPSLRTVQSTGAFRPFHCFHWPTCLFSDLPHCCFSCDKFQKLLLHPPPLSPLETGHITHWCRCAGSWQLLNLVFFVSCFLTSCQTLLCPCLWLFSSSYVWKSSTLCPSSFLMTSSISGHHPTASWGTSGLYFCPLFLCGFFLRCFSLSFLLEHRFLHFNFLKSTPWCPKSFSYVIGAPVIVQGPRLEKFLL